MNIFVWQDCSHSAFLRGGEVYAAEDVLMETAPIRMSPTGFKAFVEVASRPARPVPEMVELFQRATPWEKEAITEK